MRTAVAFWLLFSALPTIRALSGSAFLGLARGPQFSCTRPLLRPLDAVDARIVLCKAAYGGGDDSGIGGRGGDGGGGDGSGDSDSDDESVDALIAKCGLDKDVLPSDMLEALQAGRIGTTELSNYRVVLANPLSKILALSAFVRSRLIAEPRLLSVLLIEIGVGVVSTLAAEKQARGERFFTELDFVIANQVLITLTNTVLVLSLCPAAKVAVPPRPGSGSAYLAGLPGFFLQAGEYTKMQRAACFVSKGLQFGCVGAATSATGQAITKKIVDFRTKMDPDNPPKVKLAPIASTSAAYAAFMLLSSNTRYQLLNSFEARLLIKMPASLQTGTCTVVRTLNNYVGSANWILWAKFLKLQ